MSNPWSDIYKDIRKPYLEGLDPVGKEDGDVNNDGKKDSSDSYLMKRRKAIAKAMGKEDKMKKVKNEHHQKDADGNPVEHGDGTPSNVENSYTSAYLDELSKKTLGSYVKKASKETRGNMIATQHGSGIPKKARDIKQKQVFKRLKGMEKAGEKLEKKEGYEVNLGDKEANTPAYKGLMSGKKNVLTGKPLYTAGVSLKKAHYEPPKVNKPNYSSWREDFIWDDNVDEAAKGKKLDVKENGVKNKIEINPDDGLKEEKKKLIEKDVYLPSDSNRTDMGTPKGLPKEIRRRKDKPLTGPIYHSASYNPKGEMVEAKDDKKKKGVKGIAKELDKAVAMHKSQAKRLRAADVSEAKYEQGASTYGKASIRNKRMFGKGGNAAPPEERGAAISVRRDRHAARRGIKKGNKYHEAGKYRPEVDGVNKPEQERKGKNMS